MLVDIHVLVKWTLKSNERPFNIFENPFAWYQNEYTTPPHALCLPTCIRKLPPYPSFYTIPILLILSKYCLHKLHVTCSSQELHVSIMYMYKLSNCQCRKLFYRVKREENTWRHIKMTYLFV